TVVIIILAAVYGLGGNSKEKNLTRLKGVKASCDSMETEELSADKAIDGDDETLSSRWSSENNWEDASHYIELEFPEEISVSFVILKWERTNVTEYRLEGSTDGENWEVLADFHHAPETKRQEIALAKAAKVRFLRMSTSAVSQAEEDYSNLYQNVSLYEFEVYADKPAAYLLEEPVIETRKDNSRYLKLPKAPEGYQVTYLGADYEQIIGADCEVYATIQDKEVTVGYLVEQTAGREEAREISFTIQVPAAGDRLQGENAKPEVIPALAEWDGADGVFMPEDTSRIVIQEQSLRQSAQLFAERYELIMGREIPVEEGNYEDVRPGDFYLTYGDGMVDSAVSGVGSEGYVCNITDKCVIIGTDAQGIYWGTITILQILKGQTLPQGKIRDYPKYQVRGFGIDVARKPVSMDMLYQIMKNMSWYKMNDLSIHLNDNVILSTSGLTGSIEEAMTADSAFRLEVSVANEKGEKLTSDEYAYTAQEFADFINTAKAYGVQVVPEIDTPAHSLSITKLFPEYALTVRNEAVDQIDVSRDEAVELIKDIWREVLNGQMKNTYSAAFGEASAVNIGMDEYYGDGETYRQYMNEIISLIREESDTQIIRLWGSLSNIEGKTIPDTKDLQMNLWSTTWADPMEMYEAGYSLINMQNNHLYIIPGGGYDYLDTEELFANWEVNKFYDYNQLEYIPVYSPQMLGASYMIWNDMCGRLDVGICESDLFDRFYQPLGVISAKLWGSGAASYEEHMVLYDALDAAPDTNPYALAAWSGADEGKPLRLPVGGDVADNAPIVLSGGEDYIETGYTNDLKADNGSYPGIGGSYTVSMQVYRENISEKAADGIKEEILFEADAPYGQTAFKAVQTGSGKVGFSREGKDYSFAYTLPVGEWVSLTIQGEQNKTSLYVNGELVDTLGDDESFTEYATFVFPLERIGSKTDSFHGMIKEIEITGRM
ncbi:MAG: family 20 glycosylhydrolase, partial [Bacillus sp. (in: Bacteria)]|nr:family 20 glycosylhydrolase [Bacillus sp. (in: firmicutes)]